MADSEQPARVLVVCTGNSCRSIMAEALINARAGGRYAAFSAGSSPAGYVHPGALRTLEKHGIDAGDPRSKSWDEFAGQEFDYVITVCDSAAGEPCPAFAGDFERLHWSTPDPAAAQGSDAEIETPFESAFARLKRRIETELP